MGWVALGLSSAVCVGWRLIELPALLLLVREVNLLLDESGCGLVRFPSAREEGFELFANDAVEESLLGGSGRVAGSRAVSSRPKNRACSLRSCAFGFAGVPGRALAHRSRRCVRGSCRCVGAPQGLGRIAGFPRSRRVRRRAYSGARSNRKPLLARNAARGGLSASATPECGRATP